MVHSIRHNQVGRGKRDTRCVAPRRHRPQVKRGRRYFGHCSVLFCSTARLAMAYEALIVIGFGVSLAVVSVALFVAHVKRINAPNRADPSGIVVHIDLGEALAKDEAARNRKLASRRSISKGVGGELGADAVSGAFTLQQDGVGRRRRRPCPAGGGGGEGRQDMGKVDAATATATATYSAQDTTATQVRQSGCEMEYISLNVCWYWSHSSSEGSSSLLSKMRTIQLRVHMIQIATDAAPATHRCRPRTRTAIQAACGRHAS